MHENDGRVHEQYSRQYGVLLLRWVNCQRNVGPGAQGFSRMRGEARAPKTAWAVLYLAMMIGYDVSVQT